MSHTEATPCKLPLLDGEKTTGTRLLSIETEFELAERFQGLGSRDTESFSNLLWAAWGLLLRCFTGQDKISFHFLRNGIDDRVSDPAVSRTFQSTVRMVFDEQDSLATCYAKAKDGYDGDERSQTSLAATEPDSPSFSVTGQQNTYVWVQNPGENGQDAAVDKVF